MTTSLPLNHYWAIYFYHCSDIADKVVTGTAKFEELGVASHDIAASTAQLVAASRVKARPESDKLKSLKTSSRAGQAKLIFKFHVSSYPLLLFTVSEATGEVVASAQSGAKLLEEKSITEVDYSKLTLTQAKRLEMESKVKALQLEKELDMERTRLSRLRKVHYHLAGASEGWEVSNYILIYNHFNIFFIITFRDKNSELIH